MKIKPFTISIRKVSPGRYEAIARTVGGDRVAYGRTQQQAIINVLAAAWRASTIH